MPRKATLDKVRMYRDPNPVVTTAGYEYDVHISYKKLLPLILRLVN